MQIITQGKTNAKYLLIIFVIAVIVGIVTLRIFYLLDVSTEFNPKSTILNKSGDVEVSDEENSKNKQSDRSEINAETDYEISSLTYYLNEIPELTIQEKASSSGNTDWKVYRNEKYGFEFEAPSDWVGEKQERCWPPFCLLIINYANLLSEENFPSGVLRYETDTKEKFTEQKESIEQGIPPRVYNLEYIGDSLWHVEWKFIDIDNKKAIQAVKFDVSGAEYDVVTILYTDNIMIKWRRYLPIEDYPYTKEENLAKAKELSKGVYPNEEIEKIISDYSAMLSTFRFLP